MVEHIFQYSKGCLFLITTVCCSNTVYLFTIFNPCSYGVKFDYGSIMQYSPNANSIAPSSRKYTMVPKMNKSKNEYLMGQRDGLSKSDVEAINKMYCQSPGEQKFKICGMDSNRQSIKSAILNASPPGHKYQHFELSFWSDWNLGFKHMQKINLCPNGFEPAVSQNI